MPDLSSVGKALLVGGLVLAVLGGFLLILAKVPFLGRLPGDIRIEKEHFSFYFPLVTCLFLSILASFLFWLFSKLK
jgi:hypothetical protein